MGVVTALPDRFGKYHVLAQLARTSASEIYKVKTVGIAGFEKIQVLKRGLQNFAQLQCLLVYQVFLLLFFIIKGDILIRDDHQVLDKDP